MEYILNGQAHGGLAARLLQSNFDTGMLRPYIGEDGRTYYSRTTTNQSTGKKKTVPILATNANATLQVREWITLDRAVIKAATNRLKAVADLRGRGLEVSIPNGWGTSVFQSQAMSDMSGAMVSMDGLPKSPGDRPLFSLTNLPLPIIHKDFSFPARQIATSRQFGIPLDTTSAENAGTRVAEGVEQMLLGVTNTYAYAGGSVYGYTNFPNRITKALSSPLLSGWTARTTLLDVLAMRQLASNNLNNGPYVLYVAKRWDAYMDDDAYLNKGSNTLRDRLRDIEGISDVVTLDWLNGYDMILVELNPQVARLVTAMDVTTLQWDTEGGMEVNFKVMTIMVPQLRTDFNGYTGIVHGSVAGQTTQPTNAIYVATRNP